MAARAEAGEILVCRAAWNDGFLDEVVAFPQGRHDDQVDALSGSARPDGYQNADPSCRDRMVLVDQAA